LRQQRPADAERVTADETGASLEAAVTVTMAAAGGRQKQKRWGQESII